VTLARGGTVVHRVVPAQLACRLGARPQAGQGNAWPAVVSIAVGSFALVFSEVIPVGLLGDISGHLRVPAGTGGLMVVVPAAAAAVAAPVLALCAARLERRGVLAGLSALVVVSDVIAGLAAVAAAGSLTLLGRAGAAISSPPAGPADLAREPGQQAPAPAQGAADTAGNSVPRAR
jgi:hypothetical protein